MIFCTKKKLKQLQKSEFEKIFFISYKKINNVKTDIYAEKNQYKSLNHVILDYSSL